LDILTNLLGEETCGDPISCFLCLKIYVKPFLECRQHKNLHLMGRITRRSKARGAGITFTVLFVKVLRKSMVKGNLVGGDKAYDEKKLPLA